VSFGFDSALGPGREFDRIRKMAARWRERSHGLGDDCAFVEAGGEVLAVSVDLSVEDVHFRRAWLAPAEIGYRAATAALSDLAAVAAEPVGLLLSLGVPASDGDALLEAVADGVGDAAADAGALVLGGDLTRADRLTLDCCVIGRAPAPVRRRGAREGDKLLVTGRLGGPLAALAALQRGEAPAAEARARWARPQARIAAGRYLAARRVRAMIDVSDGLAGDLRHLLAASGVGATLDVERIPVLPAAAAAAAAAREPVWRFASRSGEEYELLAAAPSDLTEAELADAPLPISVIGVVERESGLRARERGAPVELPEGWDHFAAGG
jgi:thiamine-monophosphate kinase